MTTTTDTRPETPVSSAPTTTPKPSSAPAFTGRADRRRPLTGQAAPHAAVGCLVLAASAVHAAQALSGNDQTIAVWTAAVAVVVAVVAAVACHVKLDDPKSRVRAFAFCATAAAWMSAVAFTGPSLDAVGLLAAIGAVLSLHWWRKRRIPNTGHKTAPATPRRRTTAPFAELWAANIGTTGSTLAGTRLEAHEEIDSGHRYVLRLVPGKMSMSTVVASLDNIRTGLDLMPDDDMILERHPTKPASYLLFTVVTRSPVKESVMWPGPSAFNSKTGRVNLGPFTDGEGVATWKAYTSNRLWGGFMSGGTGSGKSRTIESIAFSLAASESHPTVVWFADGQGGASSPTLAKHADHKATTHEQIHAMLAGAQLVMMLRQDENVLNEAEGFTPAEDRPGLLIIVDECQKPLSKLENPALAEHTQYLMATIAREGGKVGVALLLASQQSTLDAFGGAGNNAEALRSNLLTGNGLALKSKDQNAKQVFGIDINPKSFPDLPGYGFLIDCEPGGRSAPYRGYYLDDTTRDYWAQRITWRSLDPGAANAYGRDYIRRRELATEAREALRRRVEARRAGTSVAPPVAESPVARGSDGASSLPSVARFPRWVSGAPDRPAPGQPAPRREMHAGHRKVLDAIAAGHRSPKAIQDATGYSERQVHNLLKELRDEFGQIVGGQDTGRHGEYVLAPKAAS